MTERKTSGRRPPHWPPESLQSHVKKLLENRAVPSECGHGLKCLLTQHEEIRIAYEAILTYSSNTQHADQFLIDAVECFTDCWLPSYSHPQNLDDWKAELDKLLLAVNTHLTRIPATDLKEEFQCLHVDELIDKVLECYGNEVVSEQFADNQSLRKALRGMGLVSLLEAMRESNVASMSAPQSPMWKDDIGYETPRQIKGERERQFVRRLKALMRTTFIEMPDSAMHHSVVRIANTLFDTDWFNYENVRKIL